jgi:hypothetical protein
MMFGWLATAMLASAADPVKQPDWPAAPAVPDKMPPKTINVNSLSTGQIYVVQSDEAVQLLASPEGRVTITTETGPIKIRGVFVDSGGKVETRTYEKKQVFLVERVAQGDVELLMVPKGPVTRRIVIDPLLPIPPPKPVEPPKPVDPPVTDKSPWDNAPGLRVLIVYPQHGVMTADQHAIITGKRYREYVDAKCVKEGGEAAYWFLKSNEDASGLATTWQKAYAMAANRTWYIVGNGARWEQGPLPATVDAMLAVTQKYGDTFGGTK